MTAAKPKSDESKLIAKINREVADFFEITPLNPVIVVHDNWDNFVDVWSNGNPEAKKQAPEWLVAFMHHKTRVIHILSRETMPSRGGESGAERFEKILKHEITHIYVNKIGGHHVPSWLNEGVSLYVADQDYELISNDSITIDLLDELNDAYTDARIYQIGWNMVSRIMNEFGKEKLIEIITINNKNDRYSQLTKMFSWLN